MRGTIEAGAAETWSLISVQECPLPFSIRSSAESQQGWFLGPCVGQIRLCSVTPQPRSSWFSAAGIWSGLNRGWLPLGAFPLHQRWLLQREPVPASPRPSRKNKYSSVPPHFLHFSLSLSLSLPFSPSCPPLLLILLPSQRSAGWFLLVSLVLLQVSSG